MGPQVAVAMAVAVGCCCKYGTFCVHLTSSLQ
jgi:hypothetical protein